MIDLKKFNNSIEISSQDQLDTLLTVFKQAGLSLYIDNDILHDLGGSTIFTKIGDCGWGFMRSDLGNPLDGTIQFKDFMKELNMNEMKYKQGDILVNIYGEYRRVLGVCGEVYFLSKLVSTQKHNDTKVYDTSITQYELDNLHYHLYTPPKEVEMTVAEISEALGKTVKVVE